MTCASGLGSSVRTQDETEIRGFLDQFIAAFNNLNWESFRNCFADDATVIHPALYPRRLDGRAAYEPAWKRVFEKTRMDSGRNQPPYMNLQPLDTKVQMTGTIAVVTFHLKRSAASLGRRTVVLRRDAGGWKIIHLHASNVDF